MRVVVTGGAGFIGRRVVERLVGRGDDVVALVRDPARTPWPAADGIDAVRSDLSDPAELERALAGSDAVVHMAGMYRVGIRRSERAAMWDANVGATTRVLHAARAAGVGRTVYVSTANVFGDTGGRVVDETYRRDPARGFLSVYDETKYRAHEVAADRIAAGDPVVIAMPGGVYGPGDHSAAGAQLREAFRGRLRYLALLDAGLAWAYVDDTADGLLGVLDRARIGEAYDLTGPLHRLGEAVELAARIGGHRPPRLRVPTGLLRAIAPLGDRIGMPGLPPNLSETISSGDGVTYWASAAKAERELGFSARSLESGLRTWLVDNAAA